MGILRPLQEKTIQDINNVQSFVEKASQKRKSECRAEWISPLDFILKQTVKRYDLIIRDLAIGEMLGENDIGLYLWEKLSKRAGIPYERRILKLKALINGFDNQGGYDTRGIIAVDSCFQNWGGGHRTVLSLRWNILEIPVIRIMDINWRVHRPRKGCFDTRSLRKCRYTEEEIKFIKELSYEYIRTQRKIRKIIEKEG